MDTPGDGLKATGALKIVSNPPTGGSGGTAFRLTNAEIAVKTISVWFARGSGRLSDRDLVKAIEVIWTDGQDGVKGNQTGAKYTFTFDDNEKVTAMRIWTGDHVDKLSLATDGGRTWSHGGIGGDEHAEDVGNGILLGFTGSYDSNELISLGATFMEASD